MSPGDRVKLNCPENERLHGRSAVVEVLTDWGAHVLCEAAATGHFRAAWIEMEPVHDGNGSREQGYTGDCCDRCGSSKMKRNGSCLLCCDCGETTGCS
jgi:hypothetical protein